MQKVLELHITACLEEIQESIFLSPELAFMLHEIHWVQTNPLLNPFREKLDH